MRIKSLPLLALAAVFITIGTCFGAELEPPTLSPSDPDLPQPFDSVEAQEILANSPFTRPLDITRSLQLTGIAYVQGRPVATFFNRETKGSFILSDEPNAYGWRLVETNPNPEIARTVVKVQVLGELVTVGFGDEQIDPGPSKKGSTMGRSENTHHSGKHTLVEGGQISDKSREKITEALARKHPEATQEQLDAMVQKSVAKAAERELEKGNAKSSKSSKPGKNR